MIRDTQRSARCIIKLASALRQKRAMSDLGKKILGHGLVGAGGGLVIGSTVGKDTNSSIVGSGLGAIAGGIGGATEYYLQRAQEAKMLLDEEKTKRDLAELSKKLGVNPKSLTDVDRDALMEALRARLGNKGVTNA